jgi:hypothetical protein
VRLATTARLGLATPASASLHVTDAKVLSERGLDFEIRVRRAEQE